MELQNPKPVRRYAYALAIEEFEVHAERYTQQTTIAHHRQFEVRLQKALNMDGHIGPSFSCDSAAARSATKTPITSFENLMRLYEVNCNRIVTDLAYKMICSYLEEAERGRLAVKPELDEAAHSSPSNTGLYNGYSGTARPSNPSFAHRRIPPPRTGNTTAADLLDFVLGKSKKTNPGASITSSYDPSVIKHGSNTQSSTKHVVQERLRLSRTSRLTGGNQGITLETSHRRPKESCKQRSYYHQNISAILRDPAIVKAVPYDAVSTASRLKFGGLSTNCDGQFRQMEAKMDNFAAAPCMVY